MTVSQVLTSYKEWLINHNSPTKGVRRVFLGTLKKIGHPIRMNDSSENNKSLIDHLKFKSMQLSTPTGLPPSPG